ncbi:MAG TPA: TRAP transporter small permease subunit [Chryseolinea sp.]|nr:TRAP transporter small permease subunit [Chryseolinea sp.]
MPLRNKSASIINLVYQNSEAFLLCAFTFLLVMDVLFGILARYVHFEVVFSDELGKYFFVWLCAIGISAAAKDNQHVRLNFVVQRLPVNRRVTWVLSQLFFLLFTLFLFYWSTQLTYMHFTMNKSVMGFQFPMYVFTVALPVGFFLSSVRIIHDVYATFKNKGHKPWELNKF